MSAILAPANAASLSDSALSAVRKPRRPSAPNFAAWSITRNNAKKTGICKISGRQDANGLVPVSFQSFICSWVRRSRSWPYFFCSSLICGCSSCMLRLDLICLTNSGISSARTVTVRPMIARTHVHPESSDITCENSQCHASNTPDTA